MDTLKPCPFCGGEAKLTSTDYNGGMHYISCQSFHCFCSLGEGYDRDAMPDHAFISEDLAVKAWNKRSQKTVDHSELIAALAILLADCDAMIKEGKLSQLTYARENARKIISKYFRV